MGEYRSVESQITRGGEIEELLLRETTGGQQGVHVDEIADLGPGEQGFHLASGDVIEMYDRSDLHGDRRMRTEIGGEFHLGGPS